MKVNEIFYSLQGEGYFTGSPAIFLRLSGCNLKCPFCDTNHEPGTQMTPEEILREIERYPAKHLVITGGEPTLQIDSHFIELLHQHSYFVQIETNGIERAPSNADWITCSPKYKAICYDKVDELKCIYEGLESEKNIYRLMRDVRAKQYFLQPCDVIDSKRNAEILVGCIDFIKKNPQWRLSLQTHKLINIR